MLLTEAVGTSESFDTPTLNSDGSQPRQVIPFFIPFVFVVGFVVKLKPENVIRRVT
jgi:hypothetical protein